MRWRVAKTDDPEAFQIALPGEENGQQIHVSKNVASDWKSIAVRALIQRDDTLENRFGDEVTGWAERIAAGSSISPFML